tara:strand:+ start:45 stop:3383 length:3339 start_codon:yes stop_codon:yes gene_type:complete
MSQEMLLKDLGLESVVAKESTIPIVNTIQESVLLNQQRKMAEQKEIQGFWSSTAIGYKEDSLESAFLDHVDRINVVDDVPITNFTPELIKELTTGLDVDAGVDVLENASTYGFNTAMTQRKINLATQKNLADLDAAGWKGTAGRMFAMMFDPAEWAIIAGTTALATATTSPVGGAVALGAGVVKRAYDVKRALKIGALLGATENAAFEAIRKDVRYNIDINDVFIAGGAGAVLGGGLNAGIQAFRKAGVRAGIDTKMRQGQKLTPFETKFYEAFNMEKLALKIIDKETSDPSFIEAGRAFNSNRHTKPTTLEEMKQTPKQAGYSLLGLRKVLSVGARLNNSLLGSARWAGNALGMNVSGFSNSAKATNAGSVTEISGRLQAQYRSQLAGILPRERTNFVNRTALTEEDFNTALSRYLRGLDSNSAPEVVKIGDIARKIIDDLGYLGVDANVAGLTKKQIDSNRNYLTRQFNDLKINSKRNNFNDEEIYKLFETAIRQGQPNLEDAVFKSLTKAAKKKGNKTKIGFDEVNEYIAKFARGYAQTIINAQFRKSGITDTSPMIRADLEQALKFAEFEDDAIDEVIDLITQSKGVKGFKRAQARVILDEGTIIKAVNKNGDIEDLRVLDFLEEDGEQLINSYIFQMSGAIGLARNGINTNIAGTDFDTLIKGNILDEANAANLTKDQYQPELDAVQFMYDGITGRLGNRSETKTVHDFNIALRAYSFAVNMGMSGMSSLMEITNVMFEYSFMTILKSVPQYKKLLTDVSNPNAKPSLIQELIQVFGLGAEVDLAKWTQVTRMDSEDVGATITSKAASKTGRATENLAFASQKHVAYLSGLTGVTQTLRRISMLNFTNEFALAASKGKLPFSPIKRQQLGISDEMGTKIVQILNDPKIVTRNANGTVKSLNIAKWKPDVREAFSNIGHRDARTNVQESDLSTSNKLLKQSQIGRSMFQFLNFTFSSMEQQSQRLAVRTMNGDAGSVAKLLTASVGMGALMYVARTHLNAAGRSDRQEYLDERFKMENIIAGAVAQIGMTSIFSYIAQLSTGVLNGNSYAITPPIGSLLFNGGQTINNLFDDQDSTEAEWRKALRLLPYQSLYGARQVINATANKGAN